MSYVPPTPADLEERFPRFDGVSSTILQGALDEAARLVDETWPEGDRSMGLMLYAAHTLTLDGVGTGTEAQLNAEGVGDFQSIKLGSLSLTRFAKESGDNKSGSALLDDLQTTTYGKRFIALASRFLGGGLTTGDATALSGTSPYARDVPRLPGLGSGWPGNG